MNALVASALAAAASRGFTQSCGEPQGRLLQILVGGTEIGVSFRSTGHSTCSCWTGAGRERRTNRRSTLALG